MKTALCLFVSGLALAASIQACGSDDDSKFDDGKGGASGDGGPGSSGTSGIGTSGSGASGGPGGVEDGGACAAQNADGARQPAYLFFILDQSLSMSANGEKAKRWTPITQALEAFIKDPASKGISAGLELFPSVSGNTACNASTYATSEATMDVRMTALDPSQVTKFKSAWPETPTIASTPTRAVFQSVGPIAVKWASEHTDGKTAIVLLTDGYPQGCNGDADNIDNVAAEVKKYSDKVPVYVLGVSDNTQNLADLKKLADAGKTTLTLVDTADPAKTQRTFLERINDIRRSTLSCDVTIPPAPAGLTLDLDKINVSFTPSSGAKQVLTYDEGCVDTGGKGWHFDSPTAPTKISLCSSTCNVYEADPTGVLNVEFGCQRRDVVK